MSIYPFHYIWIDKVVFNSSWKAHRIIIIINYNQRLSRSFFAFDDWHFNKVCRLLYFFLLSIFTVKSLYKIIYLISHGNKREKGPFLDSKSVNYNYKTWADITCLISKQLKRFDLLSCVHKFPGKRVLFVSFWNSDYNYGKIMLTWQKNNVIIRVSFWTRDLKEVLSNSKDCNQIIIPNCF